MQARYRDGRCGAMAVRIARWRVSNRKSANCELLAGRADQSIWMRSRRNVRGAFRVRQKNARKQLEEGATDHGEGEGQGSGDFSEVHFRFMGVAAGRRDHGLRRDASATRVEASAYFLRDFSSVSAMDSSADAASATEISQVAVMRRLAEIL